MQVDLRELSLCLYFSFNSFTMKKALYLSLLFLCSIRFSFTAHAQNAPCYVVTGIPYAPDSLTAPTVVTLFDDEWSNAITIGFPFCFFGNTYSQCIIGSNGSISFNLANAGGYETWPIAVPFPSTTPPDLMNTINAPWQDINPGVGGVIRYQRMGTAPYRRFVVEYKDIPIFSCTNTLYSAQIIIYESTNSIETHIGNKFNCVTWNNGSAIWGIQNSMGTVASIVPWCNFPNTWTAQLEGVRWTPICQCPTQASPNVISGKVFRDDNGNCIQDAGEPGTGNRIMRLGPWPLYYITDPQGYYVMNVDTGMFTVSTVPPHYYTQICPATNYPVHFSSSPSSYPNANFADTCPQCYDLTISVGAGWQPSCRTSVWTITACDIGPLPAYNSIITVTLPDSAVLVSPLNYTSHPSANVYLYTTGMIDTGQCITLTIVDSLSCNLQLNDIVCMQAQVNANGADCYWDNNWDHECGTINGPHDPNQKRVAAQQFEQKGYVTQDYITAQDTLTYEIQFQNTGTDTAYNVVVTDTISPYLDAGTVQLIGATHPVTMALSGNVLVFSFNHIMLPDSNHDEVGSHGILKYKILQRVGNQPGTMIYNSANIFFDVNLPVITNQTINIIPLGTTGIHELNNSGVKIYPNPFTGIVHISNADAKTSISSVTVCNSLGIVVAERKEINEPELTLDLSALSKGVYYVKVMQGNKMITQRIVLM
jgi:uncharacterized repeat protein (TIGR01451 family)